MWWSRISKPRIAVITTAAAVSGYCLHQRQVKLTSAAPVPSPSEFGASRFAARIDERGFGDSSTVDTDSLVIDPNSRLVHPRVVTEEQKYHELIAVGTRSVTFLGYYVYSAAVYVSQDQVKNIQSLVKSADSDPVSRSSIIDLLQDNRLSKVIRIAPYRKAGMSNVGFLFKNHHTKCKRCHEKLRKKLLQHRCRIVKNILTASNKDIKIC